MSHRVNYLVLPPSSRRISSAYPPADVAESPRQHVLMVSSQDGVLVDEFGIPIYDENGEINEDQLDDYQKNPEGLQVGDKITVIGKGLRFYHVRKFQV